VNKIILSFLIVFLFQSVASADEGERRSENFAKMKSKALEHIGKKRAALNTFESCVNSANAKEGIKTCRKAKKESMKGLREGNKEERKKLRSERKEKRGKRKGKRSRDKDSDKD
jgi:hypothetical protein